MASLYSKEPNFKEIAKRENNFNYSVASLGDIYRPYLTTKQQRQYDILSEEEMIARGITAGRPNFSYKKYNKSNYPKDPNLKNVNINEVDLGKGMSKNIYLNQGKKPGQLKGHKIKSQRPSSAISTKKIKYNQDLDPAQKNRIIDVNYLHLTKLPESKKFSHVDKAIINPVQSTFSVKKIVDDNIKKHEKMMRPIVLYPDPVRIYNEQPEKILPGTLRRSQEEIKEYENQNKSRKNMMVIGQGKALPKTYRDNHVTFNRPKENRFRRKATSTKAARKTLRDSEDFVSALDDYFTSTDFKVPPKSDINVILNKYAQNLENSLNKYESEISGKKKMNTDTSKYLYQDAFKNKKSGLGQKIIKPRGPKIYPEIDYDFRRKIQERLSTLQINLRQIFDNISILKKNKTKENIKKINEQLKKARELTNYVRHLADDVKAGEKEFKESYLRPKSNSPKRKKNNTYQNMSVNLNNSFTNTSFNSMNMIPQNNNASYYRNMNNQISHNTNNIDNNITNNNMMSSSNNNLYNSQTMNNNTYLNNQNNIMGNTTINTINNNFNNSQNLNNNPPTSAPLNPNQNAQVENQLEYSSTSIGSNINPMNSFSSNVNMSQVQPNNQFNNNQPQNNIPYNTFPQSQTQIQNNNMMNSKYMQSQQFNPIIEEPNEEANINASTTNSRIGKTNQRQNINNVSKSNLYNSQPNTQRQTTQSINPKLKNQTSNYFLQSTNTFKDINTQISKDKTTIKSKTSINNKSTVKSTKNPTLSNTLTDSKMITVSLAEPAYFRNKPMNSQGFKGTTSISLVNPKKSDVLTRSHVINNMDQTINHVPMQAEEMKVNTQNYIEDERYSAFNVEFPVNYYYELTKEHEPPKNKEWYIRPHHTETFVESNNAIPDDIMNTKYISYYAPASSEKKKTRQDILEELIMETRSHINELQEDMFKKANLNPEGEKLYNKLEGLKEEAKNSFIPGYRDAKEAKQKNIFEMLKDPNSGASYTEMFDQNDDIKQTNFAISSLGTMLSELRDKERDLINIKRKEEYERIRPPIDRWYELKSDNFLNEIVRNKMVLNSGPEYFEKIEELQNEELY